ncbi:MAG: hypothetical protein H6909_01885 [Rickettsiaceae bacterium]|nr:hypothetical protein [Rickettsiaceae bacterium]
MSKEIEESASLKEFQRKLSLPYPPSAKAPIAELATKIHAVLDKEIINRSEKSPLDMDSTLEKISTMIKEAPNIDNIKKIGLGGVIKDIVKDSAEDKNINIPKETLDKFDKEVGQIFKTPDINNSKKFGLGDVIKDPIKGTIQKETSDKLSLNKQKKLPSPTTRDLIKKNIIPTIKKASEKVRQLGNYVQKKIDKAKGR